MRMLLPGSLPVSMPLPTVELLQLMPMLPPLAPGTEATPVFSVQDATLYAPVWLPQQGVAVLDDRGSQWLLRDGKAMALASGVRAHAMQGAAESGVLATSAADRLLCVAGDENAGVAVPLPHLADGIASVALLVSLSNGRLLAGLDDGRLVCLSVDSPPLTLREDFTGATSACISDDGASLFLCSQGTLSRYAIDVDAGYCSDPEPVPLEVSATPTAVLVDRDGNFYVGTAEGLTVCSPTGDALVRISTPSPVTGISFGGPYLSELYIAATDTLWKLQTGSRGVSPPSAEFLKRMGKLALDDGDFRHMGW